MWETHSEMENSQPEKLGMRGSWRCCENTSQGMGPRSVCQGSMTEEGREMRAERWVRVKQVKTRKMLAKGQQD